jgi:GAF domain-containing protein
LAGWHAQRRLLGFVIGLAGAAIVSALSFTPHPPPIIPALIYLIPVAFATVVGGRVAGGAVLACSVIGLEYLFLPPVRSWRVGSLTTLGTSRVSGWLVLAVFVAVGAIAIELVAREGDARRRARAAESRLALLSEVSSVLSQSFDYEKTLTEVARIVASAFEGACLVRVRGHGDRPERLVTAHRKPSADALVGGLRPPLELAGVLDSLGPDHDRSTIVLASDEFLRAIAGSESNLTILRHLGAERWILAPMVTRDSVLGTFAVATDRPHGVADADVEIVADVADRAAIAVSGALVFAEEERAREDAVAAAGRTARIQAVMTALSASVSPDEVGTIIAKGARDAVGAARCAVYELSSGESSAVLLAATGYTDAQIDPFRVIESGEGEPLPSGLAMRQVISYGSGPVVATEVVTAVDDRYPPDTAALVVPLLLKGRLGGYLFLGFDDPTALGIEDLDMLRTLAGICAQVLDRARLVQEEQSARAAAEQAATRLSLVSRASALLAVELDYPRAYSRLAELLVEHLADLVLIDVMDGDVIRRVAAAHADPSRQEMVETLRDRFPPTSHGKHPVSRVLRTGQPEMSSHVSEDFLRETARDEEHFTIIRALGFRSFMCVPLAARGRILGTITLVSTHPRRRYGDADLAVAQEVARRAAVRIDNARLYAAEQEARRAAEAAASLISALSDAVSLEDVLDVVSLGMRDALGAANSTVALVDPNGSDLEVVRWIGRYALRTKEWSRFSLDADLPMSEAIRNAAPIVLASQEERNQRYPSLAALNSPVDHSLICLPLQVQGRAIGGIALGYPDVRIVSPSDTRLAMTLAGQAAQALGRAMLYEAESESRREAEKARERLSLLADASRVLSSSLDWNLTLSRVAHLAVPAIADWCAVDVIDDTGRIRRLSVAHADPQKAAASRRMEMIFPPDADAGTSAARVIHSGKSELIADVTTEPFEETEDEDVQALLRDLGLRSVMVVPLPARGNIVGAISFALAGTDRRFGHEDLELAEDLARRAGVAIDNARLYQERDRVAHTLQQSLLPRRLPAVPGMEFEGRYHPLGSGDDVGGDFYDVFDSGDGTWGMTIGDVCGKGPEAAAVMGVVRYTLRATAMHEDRPSSLLSSLNDALRQHLLDERFCTVAYVRIRPGGTQARLTVCLAGHPPPVVLRADGAVERVGRPGTILGVLPDLSLSDVSVDLAEGDAIVLFTDGLTDERRGREAGGEAALTRALQGLRSASATDIANVLDSLITDPSSGPPRDDAAVLVARMVPRPAPTPE